MSTTSVSVTETANNVVVPSVTDTTTTTSLSLTQTGGKKKTKTAKKTPRKSKFTKKSA